MTETPIKIPRWLSARVYNLNLVPDAGSYDEIRHYSSEDIIWLLNQISDEDEIREYTTVDCGDGVTIKLPSRIRFKANMPNFEWTSCRLDYYDKVEHKYLSVDSTSTQTMMIRWDSTLMESNTCITEVTADEHSPRICR